MLPTSNESNQYKRLKQNTIETFTCGVKSRNKFTHGVKDDSGNMHVYYSGPLSVFTTVVPCQV